MSINDFQNGFALGLASGGTVEVENVQALSIGKKNLAEHGIELGERVTTIDIAKGIARIPGLKYAFAFSFRNSMFPENTEVEIENSGISNYSMCFYNTNLKRITLKGNENNAVINMQTAFGNNELLTEVDLSEFNIKIGSSSAMFQNDKALINIKGEFDFSEVTNVSNMFYYCSSLEEFRIKANTLALSMSFIHCPALSERTIESIINGLATVDTAQTLTLNKNIILTDEQKATINAKGWTLAQ